MKNGLNKGLPFRNLLEKQAIQWKDTKYPLKKKFLAQWLVKKVMLEH